ncbi:MAG: hypothetical protein KAJ35_04445, partial [Thermoplasmata archaeon]|nr:hypothetical protein [Thermoplasmata archaeon]
FPCLGLWCYRDSDRLQVYLVLDDKLLRELWNGGRREYGFLHIFRHRFILLTIFWRSLLRSLPIRGLVRCLRMYLRRCFFRCLQRFPIRYLVRILTG